MEQYHDTRPFVGRINIIVYSSPCNHSLSNRLVQIPDHEFPILCTACWKLGISDVQAWPEALSQARPGPEKPRPSQAKALLRPWLRAWLEILKAQAKPSGPGLFIE